MLKKQALSFAVAYTIVITVLSFISLNGVPSLGIDYEDKIIHAIVYFGLALLWFYYFKIVKLNSPLAFALVLALVYGIVIEVLQGSLSQTRQFDFYDIIANTIGALLIVPVLKLINRDVKK